ncbi:MAG: hypothetical protein HS130_02715 [Deltaproteobacteria bacterium]|nr:hypothetical protein [Deltaproteobacteria bacterium]
MARKRSPNFPTISIDKATELVQKLYNKYLRSSVPVNLAIEAMGYSVKSSGSKQLVATLTYYGLIEAKGQKDERKVSVSELAFKILKNPNTRERDLAIRAAALKPSIFHKIYSDHQDHLPQEELLAWELEDKYDFNPKSIRDFISIFNRTMNFAKVYDTPVAEENNQRPFDEKSNTEENLLEEASLQMIKNTNSKALGQRACRNVTQCIL